MTDIPNKENLDISVVSEADLGLPGIINEDLSENYDERRRQIRNEYRTLIDQAASELEEISVDELKSGLDKANALLKEVKLPREATFDTTLMKEYSSLLKKKSGAISTGFQFSSETFARRLIAFMKNMNPADVVLATENEETATPITAANWDNFSRFVAPCFRTAPAFHYMYGGFEREPEQTDKPQRLKKERASTQANVLEVTKPLEVTNRTRETEEQVTARKVKLMKVFLDEAYKMNGRKPISYMEFVLHPTSFSKTVEHMFFFTFLIKDGLASFDYDENRIPVIAPIKETGESNSSNSDGGERHATVLQIDMAGWRMYNKFSDMDKDLCITWILFICFVTNGAGVTASDVSVKGAVLCNDLPASGVKSALKCAIVLDFVGENSVAIFTTFSFYANLGRHESSAVTGDDGTYVVNFPIHSRRYSENFEPRYRRILFEKNGEKQMFIKTDNRIELIDYTVVDVCA
uniref:Non-structural maintenance of chromosomes element 4 n=1 Tax=Romanomermis culicivorax TaxID=13658 RepID=A0A915IIR8_ROMCU